MQLGCAIKQQSIRQRCFSKTDASLCCCLHWLTFKVNLLEAPDCCEKVKQHINMH